MKTFKYQEKGEAQELNFSLEGESLKVGGAEYRVRDNSVWIEGRRCRFFTHTQGNTRLVYLDGEVYRFEVDDPRQRSSAGGSGQAAGGAVKAQMPGKVLQVNVKLDQKVEAGEQVVLMESMKMELAMNASVAGIVKRVEVEPGQMVAQGALLVEIQESES